jgi:hypothetical protein
MPAKSGRLKWVVQFVARAASTPRYGRGDVPLGFQLMSIEDERGRRVARYRYA